MASKREKAGARRRWMTVVLSSVFVVLFFVFLLFYLPRIQHVELMGADQMTVDDFFRLSDMKPNEHIIFLDRQKIIDNVKKNPYYSVEKIEYSFPSTLNVQLLQRTEDACLRYLDHDIVIARDGTVLRVGERDEFPDILRLQGVSITGYALGEPLGVQDEYQMNTVEKLLVLLYDSRYRGDYQIIDISNPVDIKLLSRNRITVRIGQMNDINAKLFRSAHVLRELAIEGTVGGIIDASTDMVSYRSSGEGEIDIPDEMGIAEEYVLPESDDVQAEGGETSGELSEGSEQPSSSALPQVDSNAEQSGDANSGYADTDSSEEPRTGLPEEGEVAGEDIFADEEEADIPEFFDIEEE